MPATREKICLVLGPDLLLEEGLNEQIAAVREKVIGPALARFPEYKILYRSALHVAHDPDPRELLFNADLVIADLTASSARALHDLGVRHATERDVISLAPYSLHEDLMWPGQPAVLCRQDNLDLARENLVTVIRGMTSNRVRKTRRRVSPTDFADRIEEIAEAIKLTRINSTAEHVEQLLRISHDLRSQSEQLEERAINALTNQALLILQNLDELIGSSKLGKLVISGALAGLVSGGGVSAAAIFGLSIAVWEGSDYFRIALNKYLSGKKVSSQPSRRGSFAPRISRHRGQVSGDVTDKAK